jgi:uncharacterized Zn-binding protein involved in type VI secretion
MLVGNPTFVVDGFPVCFIGSVGTAHPPSPLPPIHTVPVIVTGAFSFVVGGIPIATTNSIASCGDLPLIGSLTFEVG